MIPPLEVFSSVRPGLADACRPDRSLTALFLQWRKPEPPEPVIPHCQTMTGKDPLEPVSYTDDFTRIEWNGKAAWSSSTPGGQIRFKFKGTKVGLFLWVTNGHQNPEEKSDDPVVKAREAPGMGKCWVEELDDDGESSIVNPNGVYEGFELNTHIPWKMAAQSEYALPFDVDRRALVDASIFRTQLLHRHQGSFRWRAVRSPSLCFFVSPLTVSRAPTACSPARSCRPRRREAPSSAYKALQANRVCSVALCLHSHFRDTRVEKVH